jgi:hypothetical protein
MIKIFLSVIFAISVCSCTAEKEGRPNMSLLNDPMISHCVGRNIIDLPESFVSSSLTTGTFKPVGAGAQDPAFEVTVHAKGLDRSMFEMEISKRRAELKEKDDQTVNIFKLERKLNENATLFRVNEIEDAYVSEVILLVGTNMVAVRYDSFHGRYLEAEDRLIKFLERINSNKTEEATGFCLGPIAISGDFKVEKGSYLFRNGKGADFEVDVDTYTPGERVPLLARMSGPDSLLTIFDVDHTVLRARERSVAGMRTQEWLGWAKVNDEPGEKKIQFNLETMRNTPGKTAPSLTVAFETAQPLEDGRPTKTEISEKRAIQLWDSVVDSIRQTGT